MGGWYFINNFSIKKNSGSGDSTLNQSDGSPNRMMPWNKSSFQGGKGRVCNGSALSFFWIFGISKLDLWFFLKSCFRKLQSLSVSFTACNFSISSGINWFPPSREWLCPSCPRTLQLIIIYLQKLEFLFLPILFCLPHENYFTYSLCFLTIRLYMHK